ncbi:MAG: hypothetical protein KC481_13025, partial [Acidimicrobiaceae bacterium]|nr:hypothetical protein [Acidimicrobiaceae bacterium]
MEQPPTPSSTGSEPDLPKPPIWDRPAPAHPKQTPIVPDITQNVPLVGAPVNPSSAPTPPAQPTPQVPLSPQAHVAPPQPAATVPLAARPGPSFADRSFMTAPAPGSGMS